MKESLPGQRKRQHSLREIGDASLCYQRLGSQWRHLPDLRKWQAAGTLEKLNWALNRRERTRDKPGDFPRLLGIDSPAIKGARFVKKETGNKKGNGRQRHVVSGTW